MAASIRLGVALLLLPLTGCYIPDGGDTAERTLTRTFTVRPDARLQVDIQGGSITTQTGEPGTIRIELTERVHAESEAQMDRALEPYEVSATQAGDLVSVVARRRRDSSWTVTRHNVSFSARVTVPPDVALSLGTSGGSVTVRGERTADVKARTSGGSIRVDEGGALDLDTSGGSITVERALRRLSADTSGGGITVRYVGGSATDVKLSTSGGSIRVGVDPAASLRVDAGTSGGSVQVNGLPFDVSDRERSNVHGQLNDGRGLLRASTSGGSITIAAASND